MSKTADHGKSILEEVLPVYVLYNKLVKYNKLLKILKEKK